MVCGLCASDTAGTSVSQCADTATIAAGFGSCLPSDARKARAGTSSRISVGEPCDTKIVGMGIALFLIQDFYSYHARFTEIAAIDHPAVAIGLGIDDRRIARNQVGRQLP